MANIINFKIKICLIFLAMTLLVACVSGSPLPVTNVTPSSSPNPATETLHTLLKRSGYCNHSTFINRTTPASPLVRDCEQIRDFARRTPQIFYIPRGNPDQVGFVRLYAHGTCEFAARATLVDAKMGNDDVADLMRDSINMFRFKFMDGRERVGAEGGLGCGRRDGPNLVPVRWAIYTVG